MFQAEVNAITCLARKLNTVAKSQEKIKIFSDSQAALKAISSSQVTSATILQCREALSLLIEDGSDVQLSWVPGHVDIIGNERADELARRASSSPFLGPEPCIPISECIIKSKVWEMINREHKQHWSSSATGRFTFSLLPAPNRSVSKALLQLSRIAIRIPNHNQDAYTA